MLGSSEKLQRATKRLGHEAQARVLLSLAYRTPAFERAILAAPWAGLPISDNTSDKTTGSDLDEPPVDVWSGLMWLANQINIGEDAHTNQERDERMREDYGVHDAEALAALGEGRPALVWSVESVIGRPPTRSQSATYSYALRRLKERGLLTILDDKRAHRVRLTPLGVAAAVEYTREMFGLPGRG
jgi:hypothetical protein